MPNDVRVREENQTTPVRRTISQGGISGGDALHDGVQDPLEDHTLEAQQAKKQGKTGVGKEVTKPPPPTDPDKGKKKGLTEKAKDKVKDKIKEKAVLSGSAKGDVSGEVYSGKSSTEVAGGKLDASGKALTGKASGEVSGKLGLDGASVSAKAALEGKLVDFTVTQSWETGKLDLLGEQVSGKIFVSISGMVGAEAKAKMSANLKAMSGGVPDLKQLTAGTDMQVQPGGDIVSKGVDKAKEKAKQIEADASGKAEVFAGAKIKVAAGVAGTWHQRAPETYQQAMAGLFNNVLTLIHPGVAWVLRQVGVGALVGKLAGLLGWKEGATKLLGLEVGASASLGVGASIDAAIGFKGGKLKFKFSVGATWGMGMGTSLDVTLDAKEGIKFALALAGQVPDLQQVATDWLVNNAKGLMDGLGSLWQGISDWFGSDVKTRDMVAQRVHEVVPPEKRAEMISTLIGGFCSSDDAAAVLQILRFTKKKGDMGAVLAKVSSGSITWALDGDANTEARKLMGIP